MTAGAGTEVDTLVCTNGTQVGSALIDTGPASGHPEPAWDLPDLWAQPDPPDQLDLPELSAPLDPQGPPGLLARSDLPGLWGAVDPRAGAAAPPPPDRRPPRGPGPAPAPPRVPPGPLGPAGSNAGGGATEN